MTANPDQTATLDRAPQSESDTEAELVRRLIVERRSVRAFANRPVDRAVVQAILDTARWAPSGANMQPWEVHVLTGAAKQRVTDAFLAARAEGQPEKPDYQYYPSDWVEPFRGRRMALGVAMYKAFGARKSRESRQDSWNRNYAFFGAPVGLLFFIDRGLATGSWIDYGMFLQNIMLTARSHGLETCPQASLADYADLMRGTLGVGPEKQLIGGISLGYPDWNEAVNQFPRTRAEVADFTTFHD